MNGEIIIKSAYMYLVNLLPKRFRLHQRVTNNKKMKHSSKVFTFHKSNMNRKRDDSKNKTEQSNPLYGAHGSYFMKLIWLTPEIILFS